ncbi:hypothetical protein [uncultured Paraglaciecola sp.]|uniref:hypothetical protein n=1 Tax=uncultured Paraglaciecola sp. TaxID=1765024 RepID=UPI002635647D|nr:hypothetical protein [uncultured Paraglaciecola sp.]
MPAKHGHGRKEPGVTRREILDILEKSEKGVLTKQVADALDMTASTIARELCWLRDEYGWTFEDRSIEPPRWRLTYEYKLRKGKKKHPLRCQLSKYGRELSMQIERKRIEALHDDESERRDGIDYDSIPQFIQCR